MNLIILRNKYWFVLLLLFISYSLSATNYFVSSSAGNDFSDGRTIATAWKSISKVNSKVFSAGDSIFFKRGDVWRELLTITSSGTSASYIYYGGFGSGANPEILGSDVATSWISQGSNVWKSANAFTNPAIVGDFGTEIFFENTDGTVSWGARSATLSGLYNWYWSANYIYVYSTQDPAAKFKSVEIPQRASIIGLNDKNYIHIDGIDLYYCGMAGVTYKAYPMIKLTGLIIENCTIAWVSTKNSEAGYGIDATYCDMIVRHCDIHDCGRRSVSHHLYGNYTATNILIEDNYFHDGWHTTGPDFSVGSGGTTGSIDGVIIRRNKFYDPPNSSAFSEHIFLQNYLYSSLQSQVKNIYIYSNIFISPSANAINMEGTQSVFIYNNVFYNHNASGKAAHVWADNNNSSIKVKNNIFYTTISNDIGGTELFMRSGQNLANVDANYNLYYRVNNSLRIIDKEGTGSFNMTQLALIRSQLGLEKNSPAPANPLFVSNTDYHVKSGSPAISSGLALDVVVTDFEGKSFTNPPNIGCYATSVGSADLTYMSSSVENSNPSVLVMTYTNTLVSPAPDASAFSITVNSSVRKISQVALSGSKVLLTFEPPVISGDIIKISYIKPSLNPLHTTNGGQAVSITSMPVNNNVGTTNVPPVILINYNKSVFSGFQSSLDASGTYDQNKDNLTFSWIAPFPISVSSTSSSKISFLAPIVKATEAVEFTLNVSDGKSVQSMSIEILIQPFRPELGVLPVNSMESDGDPGAGDLFNVLDGNQGTSWSSQGSEHWMVTGLSEPGPIEYMLISFPESPLKSYYFDIYASADDVSWDPVLLNVSSCRFSGGPQVFEFPVASRTIPYSYVKLLIHGNSGDNFNNVSEFRTFGIQQVSPNGTEVKMVLFPNPANNFFRLLLSEEPPTPYLVKIISMNGMVVFEKTVDSAETYVYMPVSLRSGVYIVELNSGNTPIIRGKLIIHELRSH